MASFTITIEDLDAGGVLMKVDPGIDALQQAAVDNPAALSAAELMVVSAWVALFQAASESAQECGAEVETWSDQRTVN